MTGFGKGEVEQDRFRLSVEIKSVNHRFKDIRFKMGSVFNSQEISLKKKIENSFIRGSFDIYIQYKKSESKDLKITVDPEKVQAFLSEMKSTMGEFSSQMNINPTDFLRSDFAKEDDSKEEELKGMLLAAFEQATKALMSSRVEEGEKLVQTLQTHQKDFESHFKVITGLKDSYQSEVRERILKRFKEENENLKVDETRFMQEVIYYLEKLDIQEEISRIQIHLEKLTNLMSSTTSELGRQIDFLVQELNRETNTIGSKSGSQEISESVVQMKVQLEKIREQALNLQ